MAETAWAGVSQPRLSLVARCAEVLADLRSSAPGVVSASVATVDGLNVASTLAERSEVDRMAAVSGSLGGLVGALAREVGHGQVRRVVLDAEHGRIVAFEVPDTAPALVLTVVADTTAVLGTLLWAGRQAVERLSDASRASA